jgi:SNF2 family DNA or RNA helicase
MTVDWTLDHDGTTWAIREMKPHVRLRFKQLFKVIGAAAAPPYFMFDNIETALDLHWFSQRFKVSMTPEAADRLAHRLSQHDSRSTQLDQLLAPDYVPRDPGGIRAPEKVFPYQARAADLYRTRTRLLLMDHVGLGKTVSALAAHADGWGLPAAVVVQPHLSQQWVAQYINRFTKLRAFEVKDRNVRTLPAADIYVFRYSNIAAWADYAERLGIKSLILDECQELRHGRATDKGQGVERFLDVADNVIGLTATPIYNYGSEIFNVVNMIEPGVLGGWQDFINNWCRSDGTHWLVEDPRALGSYLREIGLVLRRTSESAEVAQTLPPLRKMVVEVGWNEGDAESDRDLQRRLAERVISGSFHHRGMAARELDMLLRRETGVAKARAVAAYVRNLCESGERVLLAGWHRDVYAIWNKVLADLNPVMFTGSESQAQKARSKAAFCGGDARVMMMSLRSGAGLDGLQHHASHVVYGELDWSPQVHVQFTGRLHRTGQQNPVTAHFLHVDGGSDPTILGVLGLKAAQSQGISDPFDDITEATQLDTGRMTALARAVLERMRQ